MIFSLTTHITLFNMILCHHYATIPLLQHKIFVLQQQQQAATTAVSGSKGQSCCTICCTDCCNLCNKKGRPTGRPLQNISAFAN